MIEEVKFSYDVLGNRVEKDVDANGDGVFESITKFAYDLNGNAWADLTSGGSLTTRRVYEDAVDKLFARIGASNNPAFYLDDMLGSVRDIVNGSGSLIDNLSYDSYGTVTTETSPSNGDRYAWTSRERDSEINLQYNRARYFDPATGRWISQDPLGFDAGDGNLSRYVRNDPGNQTDPWGLLPVPPIEPQYTAPTEIGGWPVMYEKNPLGMHVKTGVFDVNLGNDEVLLRLRDLVTLNKGQSLAGTTIKRMVFGLFSVTDNNGKTRHYVVDGTHPLPKARNKQFNVDQAANRVTEKEAAKYLSEWNDGTVTFAEDRDRAIAYDKAVGLAGKGGFGGISVDTTFRTDQPYALWLNTIGWHWDLDASVEKKVTLRVWVRLTVSEKGQRTPARVSLSSSHSVEFVAVSDGKKWTKDSRNDWDY